MNGLVHGKVMGSHPSQVLPALCDTSGVLHVRGQTVVVSSSFTRPSDTTAYASGDLAIDSTSSPTVPMIEGAARVAGAGGIILDASLVSSQNGALVDFDVFLFSAAYTPDNDNSAFTPTDAEMLTLQCVIHFDSDNGVVGTSTSGADGNAVIQADVAKAFQCASGSTTLYWALVPRGAYTPVSGETFTLILKIAQD